MISQNNNKKLNIFIMAKWSPTVQWYTAMSYWQTFIAKEWGQINTNTTKAAYLICSFFVSMYVFFKIKGGKRIMFFFVFLNNVIFFFTFVGELYYCEHSREKKSVNVFICCNDIYLSKNFATGSLAKSAICFWRKIKVVHQIIIHLVHKI